MILFTCVWSCSALPPRPQLVHRRARVCNNNNNNARRACVSARVPEISRVLCQQNNIPSGGRRVQQGFPKRRGRGKESRPAGRCARGASGRVSKNGRSVVVFRRCSRTADGFERRSGMSSTNCRGLGFGYLYLVEGRPGANSIFLRDGNVVLLKKNHRHRDRRSLTSSRCEFCLCFARAALTPIFAFNTDETYFSRWCRAAVREIFVSPSALPNVAPGSPPLPARPNRMPATVVVVFVLFAPAPRRTFILRPDRRRVVYQITPARISPPPTHTHTYCVVSSSALGRWGFYVDVFYFFGVSDPSPECV